MVSIERRLGMERLNSNIPNHLKIPFLGWGTQWCWSHPHAALSTKVKWPQSRRWVDEEPTNYKGKVCNRPPK